MIVGRVVGTIVCTQKDESLVGKKMLVIQPVNMYNLENEGNPVVALDAVGAGTGELVMTVGGSSARLADGYSKVSVDQAIIGILDSIEIFGTLVFRKEKEGELQCVSQKNEIKAGKKSTKKRINKSQKK